MPKHLVTLDFEAYWDSEVTLSKLSPIEYLDHPKFQAQSCVVKINNKPSRMLWGEDIAKTFKQIPWKDCLVVAHNNAEFDAPILAWKYGVSPGAWGCTLAMARPHFQKEIGGSLKALAKHFGLQAKGSLEATNTKGKRLEEFTNRERGEMEAYNRLDVEICFELFKLLRPITSAREMRLIDMTIRMFVEPQLMLDKDMLRQAKLDELTRRQQALSNLMGHVDAEGLDDLKKQLGSSAKFRKLLESLGVDCPMKPSPTTGKDIPALAKTDRGMSELLGHPDEIVQAAARARLETKSTILESRIEGFLKAVRPDGRMPIPLRYCGADQTWRWSGTAKINAQNVPRISGKPTDVLRLSLRAPEGYKVVVADLSGIELRVNHFLWEQEETIKLFQEDAQADLYVAYASQFYGVDPSQVTKDQRRFAKLLMLGLGYQTGWKKLQDQARQQGITLFDDEAKQAVNHWRQTYYRVQQGWDRLRDLLPYIQKGEQINVDNCEGSTKPVSLFRTEKDGIRFIPRNTLIQYPDLRLEDDGNWTFQKKPKQRAKVFGGLMCENIVSHASRHVMTDAILDIAKTELGQEYPLAHCVHDEVIYVVREEHAQEMLDLVQTRFRQPPDWWPGLVTWAEGDIADSYGEAK